ncbi:YibL family ribosome-associated protein [Zhongshania borealis]|uniref:YibL family ribosome-associated protein n=2 Tax=Zhongshania borealis TaxID=889488 RepID=A0ABP7W9J3_9GAMM|tara:strand:- start:2181 stop:2564 length:384 start_codon:yes stop_codon:yes gene_type:complete
MPARSEVYAMNLNKDIQLLNNKIDLYRRKLEAAKLRDDQKSVLQFKKELSTLSRKAASIKGMRGAQNAGKAEDLKALGFSRALSKAEQADMGKFKKSVRGLVVVHPLTALGKEMGLTEVTAYAPVKF